MTRLTKQGVRDLGGNRRVRPAPTAARTFSVAVGIEGVAGMTIHIAAWSPRAAYAHAVSLIHIHGRDCWDVLQVMEGRRLHYDLTLGWV